MAKGPRYRVAYRRRREGKTNYKHRLNLLKSGKPRLVVRKSNRYILAQIVKYNPDGDQILVAAHSKELKEKFNWKYSQRNTPASYLTGLLCGYRGKRENIKESILDLGLYPPVKGSVVYLVLKGAIDSGLKIPHDPMIFPEEKRGKGGDIEKYTHKEGMIKGFEESKKLIEREFVAKRTKGND